MAQRDFYVIAYDVVDDRRRNKIARWLERYGERVQYSVFEMYLTAKEWERLQKGLLRHLNAEEDSIRVYRLCAVCRGRIIHLGQGETLPPPGPVVVI